MAIKFKKDKATTNIVHRLKQVFDKQFAMTEGSNRALFGDGIYENIIRAEYKLQITEEYIKEWVKDMPVNKPNEVELMMAIGVNMVEPVDGISVDISTAEHTLYFNYAHNSVDFSPEDVSLTEKLGKGVDKDMVDSERHIMCNTNIRNIILTAKTTTVMFYYVTKEMMGATEEVNFAN